MRSWLDEIILFDDGKPHCAALNMAMDEALLAVVERPVLRVYRWARPAVSFGYFEPWEPVIAWYPEREAMRRWTGGGVVLHGQDFTYSLLVPRGAGADVSPAASYGIIHGAICSAFADAGIAAAPAPVGGAKVSNACFENAVLHDVLVDGRKIAGAAQRRTRRGLLHQGSIQGVEMPRGFAEVLAGRLAGEVCRQNVDVSAAAEALAMEKYQGEAWLRKTGRRHRAT